MKMVNVMRLLIVSLFFSTLSANAQQWCGFEHINELHSHDESFPKGQTKRNFLNTPKIIPTIIHVLHSGEPYGTSNHIESSIVYQAIDSVNTWFTDSNADIELCIASVGPNGEAMNGIIYHNLAAEFPGQDFAGDASSYYITIQNATLIAPSEYYNIYVHGWSGGALGFATLPPGATCWVRTSQFSEPTSKTLIHEAGHWCGLYHTFEDGNFAPGGYDDCEEAAGETNCQTQGDRVCDTPPAVQNFGCYESCPGDVIESYMSYAPDGCQNLFTPGQIDRMHQQLEQYRPGVINNNIACGSSDIDLAVVSFANSNNECDTYVVPSVIIKNFGLDGDFVLDCTIEVLDSLEQIVYFENYTNSVSLLQDETFEILFDPYTFQFGDYTVVIILNTPGDGWEFNNSLVQDLPLQPFVELSMDLNMGHFPSVQWKLYEWDPETDFSWPVVYSCNWGGVDCWDSFYNNPDEIWPMELNYCLQPGCYDLLWRYTGDAWDICELLYGEPCYANVTLSNGTILFENEGPQEGGDYHYYFCIESPNPCPITECSTDIDGDGITGNSDLLQFLSLIGTTGDCIEGDFNFDGEITFLDLALFLNQYGYDCNGNLVLDSEEATTSIDYYIYQAGGKITQSELFDLQGRRVNDNGTLPEGIYIIKQYWDNGFITTKKLYLNTWNR
jgi:hypothetical protein